MIRGSDGHLRRDSTGHLVNACPTPFDFDDYGAADCAGEDIYAGAVEATYADAVADIPNATPSLVTWGNGVAGWAGAYTEDTPDPPDPSYISTVFVEAGGTTFDCDTSALSSAPSAATLTFDWAHSNDDWDEDFDIQIRIKSSAFSSDLDTAIGEGALVDTLTITSGDSDDESMSLDATARGQFSTSGDTYLGFFAVPTSEPASFDIPGVQGSGATVETVVTITNAVIAFTA